MYLSRLYITDELDAFTPKCVLVEIYKAHNIPHNTPTEDISSFSTPFIDPDNLTSADVRCLARFVNSSCQWPRRCLLQSFNYLMSFSKIQELPENFNELSIGEQTPDDPTSLNACILYRLCKYNGINTDYSMTIDQMSKALSYLTIPLYYLQTTVLNFINKQAGIDDMINIIMNNDLSVPRGKNTIDYNKTVETSVSFNILERMFDSLHDVGVLQSNIIPSSNEGAIALCMMVYGIDISYAEHPVHEYTYIKRYREQPNFQFNDKWMRYWKNKNKYMFDTSMYFNPLFSKKYYTNKILNHLVQIYNFSSGVIYSSDDAYNLLQMAYLENNFYIGPLPNMVTDSTKITLEHIDDVEKDTLLCWGTLNNSLTPVTLHELSELFKNNLNYTNPFERNSVFSKNSMNTLKMLCKHINNEASHQLLASINYVDIFNKRNDQPTVDMIRYYTNANTAEKRILEDSLRLLLDAGMYMRGWQGPDTPLPIKTAPVPAGQEILVSINSEKALHDFEASVNKLRTPSIIFNLPLVRWRDIEYQKSTSISDGSTLMDRINIIRSGESSDNISSCIRISSNWICSSAHKYLTAIGKSEPFLISELRDIS